MSLEAIEAIHVDWQSGAQRPGDPTPVEVVREMDLQPQGVTAALIGVENRLRLFALQRAINAYPSEPLMAILPGVALQELWGIVGVAEAALLAVSVMVVVTALIGMMAVMFASLAERRREMAIYRAMGARPRVIFGLLMLEAAVMAGIGALLGVALLHVLMAVGQPFVDQALGLNLPIMAPSGREALVVVAVVGAGAIVSLVPAFKVYRQSLVDGMQVQS